MRPCTPFQFFFRGLRACVRGRRGSGGGFRVRVSPISIFFQGVVCVRAREEGEGLGLGYPHFNFFQGFACVRRREGRGFRVRVPPFQFFFRGLRAHARVCVRAREGEGAILPHFNFFSGGLRDGEKKLKLTFLVRFNVKNTQNNHQNVRRRHAHCFRYLLRVSPRDG